MNNPFETEKRGQFPRLEAICPKCGLLISEDLTCPKCGSAYQYNDLGWREYKFDSWGYVVGYVDHIKQVES